MRGVLVAIDLETTGLDPANAQIIEIGAVKFQGHEIIETYSTLVDPESQIPAKITSITGITQENIAGAPKLRDVLPRLKQFVGSAPVVGHNIDFDLHFLHKAGVLEANPAIDTYELASVLLPTAPRYNLNALMQQLQLEPEGDYHRALADALATVRVYGALWDKLLERLPVQLVREIAAAGHALPWKGHLSFADAVEARAQEAVDTVAEAISAAQRVESSAAVQREATPSSEVRPLDLQALTAALEPGGKVATALENYEPRPQQLEMLNAIGEAFNDDGKLMVEAPAGTGRSLAYLLPAVVWATQNHETVVLSANSSTLQRQWLNTELPLLSEALGLELSAVTLKSRSSYLCPRRLEVLRHRLPTSIDELRVFGKVQVWLNETQHGDASELSLRGPAEIEAWIKLTAEDESCTLDMCEQQMHGTCPFYKACLAARSAQIVVANHSLLLADAAQPPETRILLNYERVIVDEAHNLEETVTRHQEFRLDAVGIKRQLADLGTGRTGLLGDIIASTKPVLPEPVYERVSGFVKNVINATRQMQHHLDTLFTDMRAFLEATNNLQANDFITQVRLTRNLRNKAAFSQVKAAWATVSQFLEAIQEAMTHLSTQLVVLDERYDIAHAEDLVASARAASRHLGNVYAQLNAFITQPDDNTVYWIEVGSDSELISIHGAPLNVAPLVKRYLWDSKKTVVMTSATLRAASSFEFIRQRLGADDAQDLALPSPFNYEQTTLLYLPTDMPEPQERNRYQQHIERAIIELAAATQGRLLALFTGYTQLRQVAQNIAPRLALGDIVVFDQSDGTSRQALLDGFRNAKRAVLLGTRSFWEDVDLASEDLVALVIVRLPFAVPSEPVYAARTESYENSFNQYTVPDAVLRFRQGFDRLIRVRTQRGIVAVLDKRMISKEYGQTFLESLPACTIRRSPLEELGAAAKAWLNPPS